MSYIVIETHGGAEYATIVTDENGENKVFDVFEEAEKEAEECQEGRIIQI
jgi:predicted Fe-Mo cluster-binding NifX family protein